MCLEIAKFILSILTLLVLSIYAYFTYLIAKDVNEPFLSFTLNQHSLTHLGFSVVNKSKVEVEIFSKLKAKINNKFFEPKGGFYDNKTSWILQPFTEGKGHFNLKDLVDSNGIRLEDLMQEGEISSLKFTLRIRYRKVGSNKWKKSSPQPYAYNFNNNEFWLDV
jgi:hypothetical protein